MIRTIIFDLGKVLIPFDFTRSYDRMAPLCAYPAAQIPERIRSCDLVERFESGQIEPRDFVQQLSTLLEFNTTLEQFSEIWSSIFLPEPLIPEEMLVALRKRHRLVLLSNTNAIHFESLERNYPLLKQFDEQVLSYKVGVTKPNDKIYTAALKAAQCAPEECFYTDDIPAYVEGAKRHGIDAVQFLNREQLEGELKARGVEW